MCTVFVIYLLALWLTPRKSNTRKKYPVISRAWVQLNQWHTPLFAVGSLICCRRLGLLALLVGFFATPARAAYLWPELRYGRVAAVGTITEPTLTLGANLAAGEVLNRIATAQQLGLALAAPMAKGFSWQTGFFGVQGTRGRSNVGYFGDARLALVWGKKNWALAAGSDLWFQDVLPSWLEAASPWGALGWTNKYWHWGFNAGWDRSDEFGPRTRFQTWALRAQPGLNAAGTVGAYIGPLHALAAYRTQFDRDSGDLLSDAASLELRYPVRVGVGRLQPYLLGRSPLSKGRDLSAFSIELGLRFNLNLRALRQQLDLGKKT